MNAIIHIDSKSSYCDYASAEKSNNAIGAPNEPRKDSANPRFLKELP